MSLVIVNPAQLRELVSEALGPHIADTVRVIVDRCDPREVESTEPEWCVFYGGESPDECAGAERGLDETDAREDVQWRVEAGVAKRLVAHGPWIVQPPENEP